MKYELSLLITENNSVPGTVGGATQTIRVQAPGNPGTTILKAASAASVVSSQAGKQIITVQKPMQVTSQPQIVTLVKTTQGMTVASVRLFRLFNLVKRWLF